MREFTPDELRKQFATAHETRSEDIAREILLKAGVHPGDLEKVISTGTGLVAYDLQAPAKNLYPVATPLRNAIPRVGGGVGTATNWRQVSALIGSGFDATGWVPEGQRAGQMSYTTANKAASYATLGEEDAVTFEAISAGRTFEDVQATMSMRLLQKTMLKEENAILWGNNSLALGTPATPTTSTATAAGATINATVNVIVVALSGEGMRNSSVAGGVATSKTVTGADGKTFTINGGSSNKSAAASQAVSTGNALLATVTAIQGAVGYAWFVGTTGNETLQAITTINSVALTALTSSNQNASAVTADCSTNSTGATAFDGLFTTAAKNGSGAYFKALATGTAGTGTVLTSTNRGTCTEVDDMLQNMWDTSQVSPDVLWVGSQTLRDLTDKCVKNAGGSPLLQVWKTPEEAFGLTAGGTLAYYYNPFMLDGGQRMPVKIHPFLPAGMIVGWNSNLPAQYQSSEVPNVAEMKVRQEYYAVDWPITTRQRQRGVYVEEVLAVYAPFAMGAITNIAKG
jgi:hypothetical protein